MRPLLPWVTAENWHLYVAAAPLESSLRGTEHIVSAVLLSNDGARWSGYSEPFDAFPHETAWQSVITGLEHALKMGAPALTLFLDSDSFIQEVLGEEPALESVNREDYLEVVQLANRFDHVLVDFIRKSSNPAYQLLRESAEGKDYFVRASFLVEDRICLCAESTLDAAALSLTETWPAIENLLRQEPLDLVAVKVTGVVPVEDQEFEVRAEFYIDTKLCIRAIDAHTAGKIGEIEAEKFKELPGYFGFSSLSNIRLERPVLYESWINQ